MALYLGRPGSLGTVPYGPVGCPRTKGTGLSAVWDEVPKLASYVGELISTERGGLDEKATGNPHLSMRMLDPAALQQGGDRCTNRIDGG